MSTSRLEARTSGSAADDRAESARPATVAPEPDRRPDSDSYLDRMEWPVAFTVGAPVLAVIVTCVTILTVFLARDDGSLIEELPRRGIGAVGVALVVAAGAPWAYWLWCRASEPPFPLFPVAVLAPLGAVGIGGWYSSLLDLGSFVALQLGWFCVLLVVVIYVAGAPRRDAVAVATGSYVLLTAILATGSHRATAWDLSIIVSWNMGFAFAVAAAYAVRRVFVAGVQASDAREELAHQMAAEERRRLARDVHDVVAHTLAVTMLHITAARMAVRRSAPRDAEDALEEAERHGRASLADVRRIMRLLRSGDTAPTDAPQPGLADVPQLVDGYRAAGLMVELTLRHAVEHVSPVAELAVYRVLQEALANAARHGTGPATVDVKVAGGEIVLWVENPVASAGSAPGGAQRMDDALAASDDRRPGSGSGSGLVGMRERIAAVGGSLVAGPENGGWTVRARVPLEVPVPAMIDEHGSDRHHPDTSGLAQVDDDPANRPPVDRDHVPAGSETRASRAT